jgi:prophage regulatory protein
MLAESPSILAQSSQSRRSKCHQSLGNGKTNVPEPDRIIRLKTVLHRTGLSRSTVYRKIAEGTFPPQIPISVHGAGWSEAEINRWVANPPAYRAPEVRNEFDFD